MWERSLLNLFEKFWKCIFVDLFSELTQKFFFFFKVNYTYINLHYEFISIILIWRKIKLRIFCIPITFNNPLKACFSNKTYMYITIQTHPTQIVNVYFLMKFFFWRIFKDYRSKKSITYHFLFRFKLKAKIRPPYTRIFNL